MKVLGRILSLIVVASATIFFANCGGGGEDEKTQEEKQLDLLKGTWNLGAVTLDGDARTDFQNVKMTISGTYAKDGTYTYSFAGTFPEPSPWPIKNPETFKFNPSSVTTQLIRLEDNIVITYTVTASTMTMKFTCTECNYPGGAASGRVGKVNGEWIFNFAK